MQNGLCRSLISQNFLQKGDTNRRFRRTLRHKRFFGANDTTADQRAGGTFILEEGQSRSRVCSEVSEPEKHTLVLSLTGSYPSGHSEAFTRPAYGLSHRPRDGSVVSCLHCMND